MFPVRSTKILASNVTLPNVVDAMVEGAKSALAVALACASAGIMIGVVTLSGVGIIFTQWVVVLLADYAAARAGDDHAGGIVLGTGMPTTRPTSSSPLCSFPPS